MINSDNAAPSFGAKRHMRGLFISVEGIDGAGKTTHLKTIKDYLELRGYATLVVREPGGTPLGEELRNLLLHSRHAMHAITELLLMFASRQELIHNVIIPSLNNKICVIADRFIDASIAYQGVGRGIGVDKVDMLRQILQPALQTDLTFVFDVSLATALRRKAKGGNPDRIELEHEEFFAKVKQAYLDIASAQPQRVKVLHSEGDINCTRLELERYLNELLQQQGVHE